MRSRRQSEQIRAGRMTQLVSSSMSWLLLPFPNRLVHSTIYCTTCFMAGVNQFKSEPQTRSETSADSVREMMGFDVAGVDEVISWHDWLQEKYRLKDHRTQGVFLNTRQHRSHRSSFRKLWVLAFTRPLRTLTLFSPSFLQDPQWFSSCLTANGIHEQDDGFSSGLQSPRFPKSAEHSQKKYRSAARMEVSTWKVGDTKQPKPPSCCKGIAGHPGTNTGLCLCRRLAIPNTNLISNDTMCRPMRHCCHGCETWALLVYSCCKLWLLQKIWEHIRIQHRRESLTLCVYVANVTRFPCFGAIDLRICKLTFIIHSFICKKYACIIISEVSGGNTLQYLYPLHEENEIRYMQTSRGLVLFQTSDPVHSGNLMQYHQQQRAHVFSDFKYS